MSGAINDSRFFTGQVPVTEVEDSLAQSLRLLCAPATTPDGAVHRIRVSTRLNGKSRYVYVNHALFKENSWGKLAECDVEHEVFFIALTPLHDGVSVLDCSPEEQCFIDSTEGRDIAAEASARVLLYLRLQHEGYSAHAFGTFDKVFTTLEEVDTTDTQFGNLSEIGSPYFAPHYAPIDQQLSIPATDIIDRLTGVRWTRGDVSEGFYLQWSPRVQQPLLPSVNSFNLTGTDHVISDEDARHLPPLKRQEEHEQPAQGPPPPQGPPQDQHAALPDPAAVRQERAPSAPVRTPHHLGAAGPAGDGCAQFVQRSLRNTDPSGQQLARQESAAAAEPTSGDGSTFKGGKKSTLSIAKYNAHSNSKRARGGNTQRKSTIRHLKHAPGTYIKTCAVDDDGCHLQISFGEDGFHEHHIVTDEPLSGDCERYAAVQKITHLHLASGTEALVHTLIGNQPLKIQNKDRAEYDGAEPEKWVEVHLLSSIKPRTWAAKKQHAICAAILTYGHICLDSALEDIEETFNLYTPWSLPRVRHARVDHPGTCPRGTVPEDFPSCDGPSDSGED